jgi:hypothetical protein
VLYEVDVKTKVKVRGEKGVLNGTPFLILPRFFAGDYVPEISS